MNHRKLRAQVVAQAKGQDPGLLDLAMSLLALKQQDTAEFNRAYKQAGLSRRKAYYLAEVAEKLGPFMKRYRLRLQRLGWSKLIIIAKHIDKTNVRSLLKEAEENTVHQLKVLTRGEARPARERCVLLRLRPEDYDQFAEAILQNGGQKAGRGLRHQEQAVMRIIQTKTRRPAPHLPR